MSVNHVLNILLVGGESAGNQALRLLTKSHHSVAGVMTVPSVNPKEASLWNVAKKQNLDCIPAERIRVPEFAAEVDRRNIDVLLNVHSLELIPEAVLDACRIGAFNLHPGPLPDYAGLDVPSWAIYNGETTHGVTLHEMVPKIDAGCIAYQSQFDICSSDTGLSMMSKCVRHGMPLINALLEDLGHDPQSVPRIPQDISKRRYFYRQPPNDGQLNWNRSAIEVVNHIRAADYSPFPSPWGHPTTDCDGRSFGVISAVTTDVPAHDEPGTVGEFTDKGVLVASRTFWIDVRLIEERGRKQNPQQMLQRGSVLQDSRRVAIAPVDNPAISITRKPRKTLSLPIRTPRFDRSRADVD